MNVVLLVATLQQYF